VAAPAIEGQKKKGEAAMAETKADKAAKPAEVAVFHGPSPKIRKVGMNSPWTWIARGWDDFRAASKVSLMYGLGFAVVGLLLLAATIFLDLYYLTLPVAAGFFLVAPILVVGVYEISRTLGAGKPVTMATPFQAWRHNGGQIGFMGFVLGLFFLAWIRLATLLFALFFGSSPPDIANFIDKVVLSGANIPFLIVGTGIGAVLSAIVFAISVVSVPMLLDRKTNVFVAIATSAVAVRENIMPMLAWAILIVLFTGAGMAFGVIGLAVTLPLIAHGTWHAYKDLVGPEEGAGEAAPVDSGTAAA